MKKSLLQKWVTSDVNKELIKELFSKKLIWRTSFFLVLSILFLFLFPPLSILIFISYTFYRRNRIHKEFMSNFAKKNNFTFVETLNIKDFRSDLFKWGHSNYVYNGVFGTYSERPIKIFNYRFKTGSGKNQSTHYFTVCEISMDEISFPKIHLRSKNMWGWWPIKSAKKMSLEPEYEKYFSISCEEDYEIEVLQIFTKEFLDYLIQNASNFSMEFYSGKIYIYDDLIISNKDELDNLYEVVRQVLERSSKLIGRLKGDFEAMHNSYRR